MNGLAVCLSSVSYQLDSNQQRRVVNFVDLAVVAHPHSMEMLCSREFRALARKRHFRQRVDPVEHALRGGKWKLTKIFLNP